MSLNVASLQQVQIFTDGATASSTFRAAPKPVRTFKLTIRSAIVRSEKPNKGLDAVQAANPNLMNRLTGFLADGRKVVIARRPGKGGMDFTKLLGGKAYAVAADGLSPVYEKGEDKKPTRIQKLEDGLLLFSSSGFYLLSSKEYPSLSMFGAYTRLLNKGATVAFLTPTQLEARQVLEVASDLDLDMLESAIECALGDENNLVKPFDADNNRKRNRGITRARQDAEDASEPYTGVDFKELTASHKDGNPFVLYAFRIGDKTLSGTVLREAGVIEGEHAITRYYTAGKALARFKETADYKALTAAVAAGGEVVFGYVAGHAMRTSVSFRRKAVKILAAAKAKPVYGDGVYVHGALNGWVKGIVTLMHSMHPTFPAQDYSAHHYVAACRQAEVGMDQKDNGKSWTVPLALMYALDEELLPAKMAA